MKKLMIGIFGFAYCILTVSFAYATPTTHIWAPSTDIQTYGKIHFDGDFYFPVEKKDRNGNRLYVEESYGLLFSLLSDKPQDNLLGKLWSPLGKIMAEAGFDYQKGFGPTLDKWPIYFNYKFGVPEDAYFKYMPALAIGQYSIGYKHNYTDDNIWYVKAAKTLSLGKLNLGRFSLGYFNGNSKLLVDKNGNKDNAGPMVVWERTMSEISDRLWLCVEYNGTQSSQGAMNYGFSWKLNNYLTAILGYEVYNNPNLKDTVTLQFDVDF